MICKCTVSSYTCQIVVFNTVFLKQTLTYKVGAKAVSADLCVWIFIRSVILPWPLWRVNDDLCASYMSSTVLRNENSVLHFSLNMYFLFPLSVISGKRIHCKILKVLNSNKWLICTMQ